MVRETRHLWVGNLPDNIREDRIREHFKRYGRVQSVKLLGRGSGAGAGEGTCATVAFMDIKSAAKAHNADKLLDERAYTTEYYEPAAIPTTASAGSSPAGSGYSASSGSVSSASRYQDSARHAAAAEEGGSVAAAVGSAALAGGAAAAAAGAAAGSVSTWRGTNDSADRGAEYHRRGNTPVYCAPQHYRRAYPPAHPPTISPGALDRTPHHRWYACGTGESSAPSTPGGGETVGGGSVSGGGGTRRRRRSGSGAGSPQASSRSSSSSGEPSSDSRASTPGVPGLGSHRNHTSSQWSSTSGRPLAICVRNLPARSSDSSLKDGLYHEYKKHGKVAWVKVVGTNAERFAVVRFKKPSDVEKALEVSQDKLFFGCKISVAPHQGTGAELEDGEPARPYETDLDENHPKATRTLFIGNLEKDVTVQQLRDKFKHFGRIIEIDVKKQSGGAGYAFCQYASISSVVEAIRAMDGEYVGSSRVKLGFGKSMATTCVWIDGLTEHTEKQDAFYEQLEKHGGNSTATLATTERTPGDHTPRYTRHDSLSRYEVGGSTGGCRSRAASYNRTSSRYAHSDHYDVDYDRRYRVYDEFGSSSPADLEGVGYEEARSLQSVVVASPRRRATRHHRRRSRDSTPDELNKVRKERHRSSGGSGRAGEVRHRSRSGSRRRRTSDAERRRHRRRREESGAESRAGTPLRDELPEGPAPADPRRPPATRDRSHLPMSLSLPKFAEPYLMRSTSSSATPSTPATAPASPPRAPSASSSSEGSAPHSPSLEERIRSLDEKYEKWSGSRAAAAEAAERGRFRHRLLDIDIKEVKPSDMVRSLLAKRSVFDEDSERLEGSAAFEKRSTSPSSGSPRSREPRAAPRALQYPFPTHPPPPAVSQSTDSPSHDIEERVPANGTPVRCLIRDSRQTAAIEAVKSEFKKSFVECSEVSAERDSWTVVDPSDLSSTRPDGPRPNRTERLSVGDKSYKLTELDCKRDVHTSELGIRTLSSTTDKSHPDPVDKKRLEKTDRDRTDQERDPRREADRRRLDSSSSRDADEKKPDVDQSKDKDKGNDINKTDNIQNESEESRYEKMHSDIREQLKKDVMEEIEKSTLEMERQIEEQRQHEKESKPNEPVRKTSKNCDYDLKNVSELLKEQVKEKSSSDRIESENCDKKTLKADKLDEESLERERLQEPHAHVNNEKSEKEAIEKDAADKLQNECLPKEMSEKEKFEKEELQENKTEKERMEKDKAENEKLEKEKSNRERAETERIEKEKEHIRQKSEREAAEREKERLRAEKEKLRQDAEVAKIEREKLDKEKQEKERLERERVKAEREHERLEKDKHERENDRHDEKGHRHDSKKERPDKDRRKEEHTEIDIFNHVNKSRKDDKHKHDRHRKEHSDTKRESKKDKEIESKSRDISRKSSRDESSREMQRKDSSDSTTSRASHESAKYKDFETGDGKDSSKHSSKHKHGSHDYIHKPKSEKETSPRNVEVRKNDTEKHNHERSKESKIEHSKDKLENHIDKQRHYSLDSQNVETKRKERLNSSSSLPANIGMKRRMSSQDILDCMVEESKKLKIETKTPERRDSKELKHVEKPKPKFNKGHFAKLLESKIKDDKKNQVKPPDEPVDWHNNMVKDNRNHNDKLKKSPKTLNEEASTSPPADAKSMCDIKQDVSPRDLEFLATLELRSSEEDEKQKAIRKEMKERKRIQQLQQIQELQMQQDAMQQNDMLCKMKDEKKLKHDDRKKEAAREKRMSTERKSREEKNEIKRRQRKTDQSTDTSDSDEPKKHSIFDIVDDGPTYISMYDKVKARSCKNMQKHEEEKRQEKIKAKFSQLKQSRAKREEKKRSTSWDEDSDSENDRKKFSQKYSMASSSEDERGNRPIRRETFQINDYDGLRKLDKLNFYNDSTNDEDPRNKLSRKNSRSRIMSDTSDDDSMKRNSAMGNHIEVKKEIFSDNDMQGSDYYMKKEIKKETYNSVKIEMEEKFCKQSLMNLFKDGLDDKAPLKKELTAGSKMKATVDIVKLENDFKYNQLKLLCNDFSSEGELPTKYSEIRKKHKKKQKKQKSSVSEDENKSTDYSEQSPVLSGDVKHRRNSEKTHKHSNRKDRRKEKLRDSIDSEECRDDKAKSKKSKKFLDIGFENKVDSGASNIRRDEKMENIFGPLSDDSDGGPRSSHLNNDFNMSELPSTIMANDKFDFISKNVNDFMLKDKEKEESRRRKERKRKEKRFISRDDDNSLDVDAAGKAIEASLFADSVPENDNQNTKADPGENCTAKSEQDVFRFTDPDDSLETALINNELKQAEKVRKEIKEKKKKKKKSKEDRQNRHHHHDKSDQSDRYMTDSNSLSVKDADVIDKADMESKTKSEECKPDLQSPSLPRLTESPPPLLFDKSKSAPNPVLKCSDHIAESVSNIVIEQSPIITSELKDDSNLTTQMLNNTNASERTKSPSPKQSDTRKTLDNFIPAFGSEVDADSENAVKSIAEFDKPKELNIADNKLPIKQEDKIEEKPRAVISQEETEDAVAALLGESFGGASDSFVNCFDGVDENSSAQTGGTSMESQNVLEEDAEEMRQAVQNLNSELEMKPDTPLSENDLQIDTDTEEQDDSQQENVDKVPFTAVTVSASLPTTTVITGEVKVTEATTNTALNMPTSKKASAGLLNKALGFPRLNDTVNIKSDQIQTDLMISAPKRDIFHQVTSTATPVISNTWTLAGNKPHLISVHANHLNIRDEKSPHLTANIVQLKSPVSQSITLNTQPRPVIGTQARMNHPFVINQMMRPGHVTNLQPPTIKIPPDHHPMYQKQSGVVISPRMTNDTRLQSPKSSPHSDMSSPRLTILSPTPQGVGLPSPNSLQQRSPGHVTVVRMQQPPLSPIQTMHLPHGSPCRTMVSPNRPNSVLVQTQAPPIHINRLPVTPILTPLSKPLHPGNIMHHSKTMTVNTNSAILHPHKILTEVRKADPRTVHEITDNSKFIITPSSLQQSTNPTVMAQNRLIMQNAGLHMANKILFNNAHLTDKRDLTNLPFKSEISKTEQLNKPTYGQSPIIHIATVNQSTSPMVHAVPKPVISIGQEQFNANRPHVSNVIHSVNSQRLLTTVAMTSVIQSDPNKQPSSVLSMAPVRSPSVLTKVERPAHVSVTSSVLSNVVMTPMMMKTSNAIVNKPINSLQDMKKLEPRTIPFYTYSESVKKEDHVQLMQPKVEEKIVPQTIIPPKIITDATKEAVIIPTKMSPPFDIGHKDETDFEELLKDTTNEIKVTKDLDRKVEVNLEVSGPQISISKNPDVKIDDIKTITEKSDISKPTVEKPQQEIKAETVMDKKDDSEGWSAKEVNIESVIKKVDEICNSQEPHEKPTETTTTDSKIASENITINSVTTEQDNNKPMEMQVDPLAETSEPQKLIANKRGGRTTRGRKSEKQQDRVQTRQISKPARGSQASRRGRGGRAKVDKKVKTSGPTLSGDVYDFHDDSGDETHSSSQNKNESRPRLILTIKSPHTGAVANAGASAVTASVSLAPREQLTEKPTTPIVTKDDKSEDFVSPALNTRKSRRLQEKDGSRNTVDEVIDDVIKNASLQSKGTTTKDGTTRRSTRQGAKTGIQDKAGADVRKSPRGGKRTRDRSSSETSMDSSDEKTLKKDDIAPPEPKIPKLTETTTSVPEKVEPEPNVTSNITEASTNPAPAPAPIPIMKPPKKMISEISAKLASTFDNTPVRPLIPAVAKESECSAAIITMLEKPVEMDSVGKPAVVRLEKSVDIKMGQPAGEDVRATNLPSVSALEPCVAESGLQRRASDAVPPGRGPMSGVVDEAELRVQSPALPHRPPLTHRTADRATPILIRACESEASSLAALEACRASPAQAGMVGGVGPMGAGGARAYRAPFVPSLPRGAHHPPPPPPVHPALAARPHHPLKHIAIVGPQPQPVPAAQSRVTHTSVPSVSPQGPITGEGMYPHFSHQHYQVYQQHFRATQQDIRVSPSPYIRSPREAEGSEAPTPPLELRRPPPSARVPRPAHSPSPADRLISGRGSPPPAHGGAGVSRLPSALPPLGPPGPPHASQVPREADSLQMLLRRYPVMWQGLLALKNDGAAVQMHFVHGNPGVAGNTLPRHVDGSTPPLRIAQRMRLEPVQLEAVHRKMQMENEHCMLLALPCGRDHMDVLQQSTNLTAGFITYLQKKQAAGIVNVAPPGHHQAMYTVHIFPSCEFANENLNRIAPDLLHRVADIAHLLIVIATV